MLNNTMKKKNNYIEKNKTVITEIHYLLIQK